MVLTPPDLRARLIAQGWVDPMLDEILTKAKEEGIPPVFPKPRRGRSPGRKTRVVIPQTEREWAIWHDGYWNGSHNNHLPEIAELNEPHPPRKKRGRPRKPKPPPPRKCEARSARGTLCRNRAVALLVAADDPTDKHLVCTFHQEWGPRRGWWEDEE